MRRRRRVDSRHRVRMHGTRTQIAAAATTTAAAHGTAADFIKAHIHGMHVGGGVQRLHHCGMLSCSIQEVVMVLLLLLADGLRTGQEERVSCVARQRRRRSVSR